MNRVSTLAAAGEAASILGQALDRLAGRAAVAWRWHRRRRTRAALDHLDDRMLRDIGLDRSDVITMRFARRRG